MWYHIILSALTINWVSIIPFIGFLGLLLLVFSNPALTDRSNAMPFAFASSRVTSLTFTKGFVWGLLVFGTHFVWLAVLLATKSHAPWFLAFVGYLLIVLYFSLTSGVWFWASRLLISGYTRAPRLALFSLSTIIYYYFIENWSLFILGRVEGYPFLNPLIPFAHCRPCLWLVAKIGALARLVTFGSALVLHPLAPDNVNFVYLAPVCRLQDSAGAAGQRVYHALANLDLLGGCKGERLATRINSKQNNKLTIIVTPETFYPFSLNLHPEIGALWSSVIPDGVSMVVGSQLTRGVKFYQAAYLLTNGLIKKSYVKQHCTPFVEKIPRFWKRVTPLRALFLQNSDEFSRGRQPLGEGVFDLGDNVQLIPQICSEFFFKTSSHQLWDVCRQKSAKKTAILFLVNDSWFIEYFKQILQATAKLKSAYLGLPVVYVGHTQIENLCNKISPNAG